MRHRRQPTSGTTFALASACRAHRQHLSRLRWSWRRTPAAVTSQEGSVSLETALIFTFLLPFLFLVAQVALMWHATTVAHAAAQVGVTAARVYEGGADGAAAARAYIDEVAPQSFSSVSVTSSRSASTVQVHVQATVPDVMGISLPPVDAVAEAPVERVTQ